jgi:hypothetical protein
MTSDTIEEGDINIQYGPKTMEILYNAVNRSYKMFWDGEISTYVDTIHSSENNKLFLEKMLEMRVKTEQDMEPPVVCIHGAHTDYCVR